MPRKKTTSSSTPSLAQPASSSSSKVTSIESKSAVPAQTNGDVAAQASHTYSAEERIRHRAYELYEQRGRHDGWAVQDWLRAEAELRPASGKRSA